MSAATRDTLQSQLEHLQAKYVGTGHADTTKLYVDAILAISIARSISFTEY